MPQLALKEITAGAGLAETPVEIAGDDPVLPVRYRIAAAASGALGALGVAVANLSAPQWVSVNARAAAVSLRRARYRSAAFIRCGTAGSAFTATSRITARRR